NPVDLPYIAEISTRRSDDALKLHAFTVRLNVEVHRNIAVRLNDHGFYDFSLAPTSVGDRKRYIIFSRASKIVGERIAGRYHRAADLPLITDGLVIASGRGIGLETYVEHVGVKGKVSFDLAIITAAVFSGHYNATG